MTGALLRASLATLAVPGLLAAQGVASGAGSLGGGQLEPEPTAGLDRPDARDGVLVRIDARIGFMITGAEGLLDRPLAQVDGGIQFGRARVGGPPSLALTVGVALGSGDFLGEDATTSMRLLMGVEVPFALAGGFVGEGPVELVPVVQVGYRTSYREASRSGFTARAALGLRLLPRETAFFLTLEPVSMTLLPSADESAGSSGGRFAVEVGVLKLGWRF